MHLNIKAVGVSQFIIANVVKCANERRFRI